MVEPVLLRVRDPADLAQQIHYHEAQATARALIESHMVPVLTVPQVVPFKAGRPNLDGSELAARYSQTVERLREIELEARAFPLDWERQAKLDAERDRLTARRDRLNDELAAIRAPGRGTRAGVVGLYSVIAAPLSFVGGYEGTRPVGYYTLDTRLLSTDLASRLRGYLERGTSRMPFHYQRERRRYKIQNNCPADERGLIIELSRHLLLAQADYL